jgi:soluble lytic murein transglycosylase-like protein
MPLRLYSTMHTLMAPACILLVWSASALCNTAIEPGGDNHSAAVFSDGSRVPVRRVFTYRQDDGVPVFTDKVPANQAYEVMEFSCYACDPGSRVDWHATKLFTDRYTSEIDAAAKDYGVDAALIRAVMHAESGFNPYARSNKGATGLMQLMPGTARDLGVADIHAVHDNINGGVKYLAMLLKQFDGDLTLATAAYNAGPASVDRYGGIPPFAETQTYVERVRILHERYKSAS